MKVFPIPFLLLFVCMNCFAQEQINAEQSIVSNVGYRVAVEIPMYECNILGDVSDSALLMIAEPSAIFNIVNFIDDGEQILIRFWKWEGDDLRM